MLADLRTPGTTLLDASDGSSESLLFVRPQRTLAARTASAVLPLLHALDAALAEGHHVAGFLAYEAGHPLVGGVEPATEGLLGWFGVYGPPQQVGSEALEAALQEVPAGAVADVRFALSPDAYADRLARIRHHIYEGDVYQTNLTAPIRFRLEGDPLGLYRRLRARQPVPFGAWLNLGDRQVLSVSPELFLRRRGRHVEARPMKGTIRRGATPAEDVALAAHLAADAKSRAENLMIVDLLRNDLSIVCEPGSVAVPALFTTEPYPTLHQMTSTVTGRLRPGTPLSELLRATFPCGSITGAPKRRAMQLIHALEGEPRGVYCGAIGWASPDARAAFSVAIRTVELDGSRGRMGVGSGVVWDSEAEAEYAECLLKARFLTGGARVPDEPFHLIETMRWADGIALLGLHLERLRASAEALGFACDEAEVRGRIRAATAGRPPGTVQKVRLLLGSDGAVAVTAEPVSHLPDRPLRLVLAPEPVRSDDVRLVHKTTRRAPYERAYAYARAHGADEALLVNERGELTEGSRTNVFLELDGRLCTPPLASGVLGGVYRRHVLATRTDAEERVLRPADLDRAAAVYVCNAVWGWRRAEVVAVPERAPEAAACE